MVNTMFSDEEDDSVGPFQPCAFSHLNKSMMYSLASDCSLSELHDRCAFWNLLDNLSSSASPCLPTACVSILSNPC